MLKRIQKVSMLKRIQKASMLKRIQKVRDIVEEVTYMCGDMALVLMNAIK